MFVYKDIPLAHTMKELITMTRSGIRFIKIADSISEEDLDKALNGDESGSHKEIFRYELMVVDNETYLEHI